MPSMNPGPVLRLQSKLRTILPKGFIAKFLWRGELKHEKNAEGLKLWDISFYTLTFSLYICKNSSHCLDWNIQRNPMQQKHHSLIFLRFFSVQIETTIIRSNKPPMVNWVISIFCTIIIWFGSAAVISENMNQFHSCLLPLRGHS